MISYKSKPGEKKTVLTTCDDIWGVHEMGVPLVIIPF
jgi:hypothetical protein